MKNIKELNDNLSMLETEVRTMAETCKKESRGFSDEEKKILEEKKIEIRNLKVEIDSYVEPTVIKEERVSVTGYNSDNSDNKMNFRIIDSIRDIVEGRGLNESAKKIDSIGKESAKKSGISASGMLTIPIIEKRAAIQATVATHGIENVPEDMLALVMPDYASSLLADVGATFMTGLVGDVAIPVYSGTTAAWATAENSTATDGAGTFSQLVMKPKRITSFIDISKQFLIQDSNGAEELLRADIAGAVMRLLDRTVWGSAAGSATQPAGIFSTVAPTTVASYADFLAKEQSLLDVNAKAVRYVTNPGGYKSLQQLVKPDSVVTDRNKNVVVGSSIVDSNTVSGIPLNISTYVNGNVPAYAVGDFSNLIVGQWGALDITVDPYTRAKDAVITIVVNAWYDAILRKPTVVTATF